MDKPTSPVAPEQVVAAVRAGWNACLRNVFSLCEQTGDESEAASKTEAGRHPIAEHFMRGRAFEAKGIARAMNGFGPEHCEDLRHWFAASPEAAPAADDFVNDASGTTWMGMRAVAWMWEASIPMPGGQNTMRQFATHWSTGPKDAERLYRESDVRAMLAASPEAAPAQGAEVAAWRAYAEHQEYCQTCAESVNSCDEGRALKLATTAAATPAAPSAVTETMIDAYLKANDAYWKRTDELPKSGVKWRNGNPREATRESLIAALAQPAPVQAGAQQAVADLLEAVDGVLESAPCECSHKRRYDDGEHMSGCYLFDLNLARQSLAAPTQAGAGDAKGGA